MMRVAVNGWTRHDSRSKHDERHKKGDHEHDQRLERKVDLSLEMGYWVTPNIALINVGQCAENSCACQEVRY
jgi:hypothetical protein